jgi:hypothetical protein
MNPMTQKGELRDKVAVLDPAMVPEEGDSEAGGLGMRGAARGADRRQARVAKSAVPKLDTSRAISTAEYPRERQIGVVGALASAGAFTIIVVAVALYFTLPG